MTHPDPDNMSEAELEALTAPAAGTTPVAETTTENPPAVEETTTAPATQAPEATLTEDLRSDEDKARIHVLENETLSLGGDPATAHQIAEDRFDGKMGEEGKYTLGELQQRKDEAAAKLLEEKQAAENAAAVAATAPAAGETEAEKAAEYKYSDNMARVLIKVQGENKPDFEHSFLTGTEPFALMLQRAIKAKHAGFDIQPLEDLRVLLNGDEVPLGAPTIELAFPTDSIIEVTY